MYIAAKSSVDVLGGAGGAAAGTATPTSSPTTSPTSTPLPIPTQMPGINPTVIGAGSGAYTYAASFTIPSTNKATTITIWLPPGATAFVWNNCTIISQNGQVLVISIPKKTTAPAIQVTYSGSPPYYAVVTNVV